jgi:hypothetical protein
MKRSKLVGGAIGVAIAASAMLAPAASATLGAGDTTATFTLTNGGIAMTTPSSATLGTWTQSLAGGNSVKGSLTGSKVTDNRNSTAGWTLSASSTAFTEQVQSGVPTTIAPANVTIAIPTVAGVLQTVNGVTGALSNGLFVATPGGTTGTGGTIGNLVGSQLSTVLSGLGVLGTNAKNAIEYTPEVTVVVPPNTPSGTYTATVTQTAV